MRVLAHFLFFAIYLSYALAREYFKTAIRFPLACIHCGEKICEDGAGDVQFPAAAVFSNFGAVQQGNKTLFCYPVCCFC